MKTIAIALLLAFPRPPIPAPVAALPARVESFADVLKLPMDPPVRALLSTLTGASIVDPDRSSLTAFDAQSTHRTKLTGTMPGTKPPVRVEAPLWTHEGTVRCGLSPEVVAAALRAMATESAPERLARMGVTLVETTVRGIGVAGVLEVELTAELALGLHTFRAGVPYEVRAGGGKHKGGLRLPDLMRAGALASANPLFRLLTARRPPEPIVLTRAGDALEAEVRLSRKLATGNVLGLGGVLRIDLARGRAEFSDFALPIADLGACGIPAVAALAGRPEVRWMAKQSAPDESVHVTVRSAGWIVKLDAGLGFRLELAVGDRVDVLASTLPAAAYTDRERQREARLKGMLGELMRVNGASELEVIARSSPDELMVAVSRAEEALRRGELLDARRLTKRARELATEAEQRWTGARATARAGKLREAADQLLAALERCAVEDRLWRARRRILAALGERPGELPRELTAFKRAGYGLYTGEKALVPRIAVLEARTSGKRPPERTAGLAQEAALGAAVAGWSGWKVAGRGQEGGQYGAPARAVTRLVPASGATPDGVLAVHVFPYGKDGGAPDERLAPETVRRVAALRIGDAKLGPVKDVELWMERLDADVLIPPPGDAPERTAPDGTLETLGAHAGPVMERAFREPMWLVAFRAFPAAGAKFVGPLVGIDVPGLDRTCLAALHVPGGVLGDGATRQLMEAQFDPARAPGLDHPEVKLDRGRIEIKWPRGTVHDDLLSALKGRTPYVGVEPGRLIVEPGTLVARGGQIALER